MQSLVRRFQARSPTTIPKLVACTTAATTVAFISFTMFQPAPQALNPISKMSYNNLNSPDSKRKEWPTRKYKSPHTSFPWTAEDLTPRDTRPDAEFYSAPRFVTHIDDHAISVLKQYYGQVLPHGGAVTGEQLESKPNILDLCSSWVSHYSSSLEAASASGAIAIAGIGMNRPELAANPLFRQPKPGPDADNEKLGTRFLVRDLNTDPSVPSFAAISQDSSSDASSPASADKDEQGQPSIDATTLTVSIDYLTSPLALLASLRTRTKPNGTLHIAISNRCFPTKAVSRWLKLDEVARLNMVAEMLVWSGWRDVEIVCLCDGTVEMEQEDLKEGDGQGSGAVETEGGPAATLLERLMGSMRGAHPNSAERVDPLWVVRGRKMDEPGRT